MPLDRTLLREHQTFLRDNLTELWEEGERGHQEFGRGAVVVDDRNGVNDPAGADREVSFYYYANQQAVGSNTGWPNKDIRILVRDYNPERQVVCVFLLADQLCAGYKIWRPQPIESTAAGPVRAL